MKEKPMDIVNSLHGSEESRMNHNKSDREGMEKREPARDRVARQSCSPAWIPCRVYDIQPSQT
jgi:hypothetical protein